MAPSTHDIRELYQKRAALYDVVLSTYLLTGLRAQHHRRRAVAALSLERGGTVIDLGCGTGLNLPLLEPKIGAGGRIIAVDMTPAMLARARARVRASGWRNVDFVEADLAEYTFPPGVDAVLSTFAITLSAHYDAAIGRAARALRSGGRMAILDLKKPDRWPEWLIRFGAWLYAPFGVSLDLADRRPWESLRRYLKEISFEESYFGGAYLAVGEARR